MSFRKSPQLSPIHVAFSSDAISPSVAADSLSSTLTTFFLSKPEFNSPPSQSYIHRTSKALKKAKKKKNALRRLALSKSKGSPSIRADFYQALHLYSILKKEQKRNSKTKTAAHQEKLYREPFWSISKRCCHGFFNSSDNSKSSSSKPTFSKDTADTF